MINAIAVDDELPALKIIESFCEQTETIKLQKMFLRPNKALEYLSKNPTDLLFLDISMPSISGIDFCKLLGENTMVIFTTAYSEFAVEGFNLNAIDYLLKPFTFDRFLQAVNKSCEFYNSILLSKKGQEDCFFVRADGYLVKIVTKEIDIIEGLDDYLKICLNNGKKPIVVRMTMKGIMEKLPPEKFIRVHRSYIIKISKIECFRSNTITVAGREIPIGGNFRDDFYKLFKIIK